MKTTRKTSTAKTSRRTATAKRSATRTVYVIAFRPMPSANGGFGGFDWYATAAERDAQWETAKRDYATDGARAYWFNVEVAANLTGDEVTAAIDPDIDSLCDACPDAQTYPAAPALSEALAALRRLYDCPDLNLDELEDETREAMDQAGQVLAAFEPRPAAAT